MREMSLEQRIKNKRDITETTVERVRKISLKLLIKNERDIIETTAKESERHH